MRLPYPPLAVLTSLVLASNTVTAKPPEFPAPANAGVVVVGKNITIQGRSMDIRQFSTRDHPDKVAEFYRQRWAEDEVGRGPGYTETDANPPWHIITRIEDGYLQTVQIQKADNGGSWGYLAMSKLDRKAPNAQLSTVPHMQESQLLNHVHSSDTGQQGESMLLINNHSLASNVNFYRKYYRERGWREDMDQAVTRAKTHVLAFTNGRRKISIILTGDNNKTRIVVNRISHDIL
ncbi:MAG: hypothetical protein ACE5GZ_00470 [Gammaproteobacteria bacterium]